VKSHQRGEEWGRLGWVRVFRLATGFLAFLKRQGEGKGREGYGSEKGGEGHAQRQKAVALLQSYSFLGGGGGKTSKVKKVSSIRLNNTKVEDR